MPDQAPPAKLYVVVDAALPPGQQLAQSVHAAFQLSVRYPEAIARWHEDSNFLVVLSAPFPSDLPVGHGRIVVVEPDLPGCPVTAVAYVPHPDVTRALANLPLALKQVAMV